jgi:hypothetical protein
MEAVLDVALEVDPMDGFQPVGIRGSDGIVYRMGRNIVIKRCDHKWVYLVERDAYQHLRNSVGEVAAGQVAPLMVRADSGKQELELQDGGRDLTLLDQATLGVVMARVNTMETLLRGVTTLQGAGMPHCDIKPDNVVWDGTHARFVDLGGSWKLGHIAANPFSTPVGSWDPCWLLVPKGPKIPWVSTLGAGVGTGIGVGSALSSAVIPREDTTGVETGMGIGMEVMNPLAHPVFKESIAELAKSVAWLGVGKDDVDLVGTALHPDMQGPEMGKVLWEDLVGRYPSIARLTWEDVRAMGTKLPKDMVGFLGQSDVYMLGATLVAALGAGYSARDRAVARPKYLQYVLRLALKMLQVAPSKRPTPEEAWVMFRAWCPEGSGSGSACASASAVPLPIM